MQQAAFVRRGEHGQRVVIARAAQIRAFERIDRDIHLRQRPVACRSSVLPFPTFSPIYSIGASSRSPSPMTMVPSIAMVSSVRRMALDGRFVGLVAVALAHGVASADRRLFDDAEEFEREVGIHRRG